MYLHCIVLYDYSNEKNGDEMKDMYHAYEQWEIYTEHYLQNLQEREFLKT